MAGLGIVIAALEDWPLTNGIYSTFVSGRSFAYGDPALKAPLARAR